MQTLTFCSFFLDPDGVQYEIQIDGGIKMEKNKTISQLRKLFKFKTVRKRMIFSFVGVFLAVIVLMGISIYVFTCRLLIEKNQESYSSVLNAAEEVFQDNLNTYIGFARMILDNTVVQQVLQEKDNDDDYYMNQSRSSKLSDSWKSYANGIDEIESLYLFDNNGKMYYQDQNKSSWVVTQTLKFEEIEKTNWYQKGIEAKGKEVFFGRDVLWSSADYISCVKTINQLGSNEKIGMLIINIRRSMLDNVVGMPSSGNDIYSVRYKDEQGSTIVFQNGYDSSIYNNGLNDILHNTDNQYEITTHKCIQEGWELIHVVEKKDIFREAGTVRIIIFIAGFFAVLLIILLAVIQAIQITKPLYQLKDNIRSVGQGEREFQNTFASDDEIGGIGVEFQKMVKEKLELKEKVAEEEILRKDSELQLLQSQINPHFLYNTLDTLYWMAIDKEADDVADLTQSLSSIFKTSLNNGEEFIAIKDEIQFIEDYLHIQNVRFEGKFIVRIQVTDEIKEIKIVKQILQPFVENAIYHGLEPKIGQGLLSLEGKIQSQYLIFEISDNGVGIEKDIDVMKGYAISNVIQRIKLHYGDNAEVVFESKMNEGTKVKLILPLKEVRDAECGIN